MPLVIHPRVRKTVGRIAALTCVAVFVSSGAAFAAQCPTQSAKQKFSKWGDSSNYFLVPGGSFEGTPAQVGWTLSGATLTSGNEPFHINSITDDQSLLISNGGSATSPALCVDSTMPSFRFFVRQTAPGSDLKIQGVVQTPRGPLSMTLADLPDGSLSSWTPVQVTVETNKIPKGFSIAAAMRFVAPGSGGWQIDDVYVDPYRAG
ncbi:MAG TPA: hypothetical protein VHW96_10300 [Solirubrobacteraceae bacterium]|nr:hypothetical protein [Solirubrobacteraceae bacterium]